jgi:TRAP transporter TAXI family solute receptor
MSTNKPNQTECLPESPFPGINPFSYTYRDLFFARESEVRNLIRLIVLYRGVLLYSESGAGKSSLINAGIIPLAIKEGYQPERIRVQPKKDREIVIERLSKKVAGEPPYLPSIFTSGEQQKDVVLSIREFEKTLRESALRVHPLLIFDQFEEWATLFEGKAEEEVRKAQESIRDMIASLINDGTLPVKILIVLREDYLAKLEPLFERCPNLPDQYLRLTFLSGDQIFQAVRGPFEKYPERYRPEIGVSLAKEIRRQFDERSRGTDIRLTEVQIVCKNLFESGHKGPDLERYFKEVGVKGVLEQYFKAAIDSLAPNQREPAVALLTRMVTPAGTRNVISENDLLNRVKNEDKIPRELLCKTLESLEQKTKLVWKEPRREVYYYEIASEFLVEWIQKKAQERKHLAEIRELEERAEAQARAHKRHQRISAILIAALLILCAIIYSYYYCSIRAYISFYNEYAKRWGIPEGVGQLTKHQVQKRSVSLRFTRKGRYGPVLKMEAVDSRGEPTPKHGVGTYLKQNSGQISLKRECRWEYVRDSEGRIVYEMAYDKDENLVWGLVYSPAVKDEVKKRGAHYLGPDGYPQLTKSAANIVRFQYSDKGYEEYVRYFDQKLNRMPGPYKVFGRKQVHDKRGLIVEMTYIDANDQPMNDEDGSAGLKTTYDKLGNIVWQTALDASRKITTLNNGWAKALCKYDSAGNRIETAFFDVAGEPTLHKDGCAGWRSEFDDRGNEIRVTHFGVDHELVFLKEGVAGWKSQYDGRGYEIHRAYFDVDGEPVSHKDGYAGYTMKFDRHGNRIEVAYFGIDEKPVISTYGYASLKSKYDDRGNQIHCSYFGVDGEPVSSKDGYAGWRGKFDDRDNQIHCSYFGVDGEPVSTKYGYASWEKKFDDRNNQILCAYFGVDGEPVSSKNGYAGWRSKFDDRGNEIRVTHFGVDHKLIRQKDGVVGWDNQYDSRGNNIQCSYFGLAGEPVTSKDGYAGWKKEFNDRNNQTRCSYFGLAGEPVTSKDGYAGWRSEFDDRGNEICVTHLGIDGEAVLLKYGYAGWKNEFDDRGNLTRRAYFGLAGEPVTNKDGYAGWKNEFDDHSNQTRCSYFGVDGEAVLSKNGYACWEGEYDDRCNQIRCSYFDVDGEAVLSKNGYAGWEGEYDDRCNQIRCSYFGVDGEAVLSKNGYACWEGEYDDRCNQIRCSYFDVDGEAVSGNEGYTGWRSEFNDRGNEIRRTHFSVDGEPILTKYGVASWEGEYDNHDNLIKCAYFGPDGEAVLHTKGYAVWKKKYDDHDNEISLAYFGVDGEPMLNKDGYYRVNMKYDVRGNITEWVYYDTEGKAALYQDRIHKATAKYDDRGNITEWAHYDKDNKLIESITPPRSVTIGTGEKMGMYYLAGRAISIMVNENSEQYNIEVTFKTTEGSVNNINAVLSSELDFGLTQSDRQYQAYNGEAEWSKRGDQEDLRAVFSIHPESITLIASAESRIKSIADLRGKKVNIGITGSGQLQNSKDVLSAFGIDLNNIETYQKSTVEARWLLQSGEIDAFFYTVGHPNENIEQATSGKVKVNIIPIKGREIDALLEKHPYYARAVIPGNLYLNTVNKRDVETIGVKATLVTSKTQDEEVVYAITKSVFDNLKEFKKQHPAFSGLTREDMLKGLSAPIHKGALKYYKEAGLIKYIDPKLRQ